MVHKIHIINNQTPCNIQVNVILDKHKPHIQMKAGKWEYWKWLID